MTKDIPLSIRPSKSSVDAWVKDPSDLPSLPKSRMKKLSIELDPDLHKRLRLHSASVDIPIAELIREQIELLVRPSS
jgi:hypothetical protein